MHTISDKKLLMLRPEELSVGQRIITRRLDEYDLKSLADSISSCGIIQPLAVRRVDGEFKLISGERRLKAAIIAGLRRIPCILYKADDCTCALYSLIENFQRADPDPFEQARAIEGLVEDYGISHSEAAARLGIAESALKRRLSLLELDCDIQAKITAASLTERYARSLLKIAPEEREAVLDKIIADGMTQKQAEDYTAHILNGNQAEEKEAAKPEKPYRKAAIGDVRLFSNSLTKLVDTMRNSGVSVQMRRQETDKYTEYRVRIKKEVQNTAAQLRIC